MRLLAPALVALFVLAVRPTSQGDIHEIVQEGDTDGRGNQLGNPCGVAADSVGNAYVVGAGTHNCFRITPAGGIEEIIDETGDGEGNLLEGACAVAVDRDDNVYVAGGGSSNVFKITPNGTISEIIDSSGDGTHPLFSPLDLATDGQGNVYVVGYHQTGHNPHNAFKITPQGVITQIIDATGDGLGNPLSQPVAITASSSGNVYVLGLFSQNVFRITPEGEIARILDRTGDRGGNRFQFALELTVDSQDNVYVPDIGTCSLFKIAPGGDVEQFACVESVRDIAVDSADNVYVCGGTDIVWKITPDGVVTELMNLSGDGMGNFLFLPDNIAVDAFGATYVGALGSANVFRISCGPLTTPTSTPYNGSNTNLDSLSAAGVTVGSEWRLSLTPQPERGPGSWLVLLRSASAAGPLLDLGSLLGLPRGGASELLVAPRAHIANFPAPSHSGGDTTTTYALPVPLHCSLVGQPWFAQAVVSGDLPSGAGTLDPWFSSAVGGVVGNQPASR